MLGGRGVYAGGVGIRAVPTVLGALLARLPGGGTARLPRAGDVQRVGLPGSGKTLTLRLGASPRFELVGDVARYVGAADGGEASGGELVPGVAGAASGEFADHGGGGLAGGDGLPGAEQGGTVCLGVVRVDGRDGVGVASEGVGLERVPGARDVARLDAVGAAGDVVLDDVGGVPVAAVGVRGGRRDVGEQLVPLVEALGGVGLALGGEAGSRRTA